MFLLGAEITLSPGDGASDVPPTAQAGEGGILRGLCVRLGVCSVSPNTAQPRSLRALDIPRLRAWVPVSITLGVVTPWRI
jgi:hypothetical protein